MNYSELLKTNFGKLVKNNKIGVRFWTNDYIIWNLSKVEIYQYKNESHHGIEVILNF